MGGYFHHHPLLIFIAWRQLKQNLVVWKYVTNSIQNRNKMLRSLADILEQELSKENKDISDTDDSTSEIESDTDSSEDM